MELDRQAIENDDQTMELNDSDEAELLKIRFSLALLHSLFSYLSVRYFVYLSIPFF